MRIYNVICRIFSMIMLCILSFLFVISLISTTYISEVETVYYVSDRPYIHFLVMLFVIVCMYFLKDKLKLTNKTIFVIGVIITIVLAIFILASMFYPRFDQRHVMNIAAQMLAGDYTEFKIGGYAEIYPYQNGLLLFYEVLALIFGTNNLVAIQFMNLFFIIMAYWALFLVNRLLMQKYLYTAMFTMLFLPLWGFVSLIYGNVPAFSFGMFGLYFALKFIKDRKWIELLAGCVCMMLSCILKMNFMILLIAIIIITVMDTIKKKDFRILIMPIVMTIFVLAGDKGVDLIIHQQTGAKITEGIPAITYVAMGLHEHSYRGAGWHDNYPENTYEQYKGNAQVVSEKAMEDIKLSFENFEQHPQYMVGFFIRKIASMWNEPSYDSLSMQMDRNSVMGTPPFWIGMLVNKGPVNSFLYQIMNLMESWIMVGAFAYYIFHFKKEDFVDNIFALFFVGGFLCHLLWEASSQYAIFYVMLLIPYATMGFMDIVNKIAVTQKKNLLISFFAVAFGIGILSIPELTTFLTLNRSDALYLEYLNMR
ncbi:MAG: hypothetical protein PHY47_05640 [Lachnospiraceae bacterium]|nr:hypothetical protein [Lachnospiraceae bacterium]